MHIARLASSAGAAGGGAGAGAGAGAGCALTSLAGRVKQTPVVREVGLGS